MVKQTEYLPAEHDDAIEVGRKLLHVATSDVAQRLIHCDAMSLVLNESRQIVFANEAFMKFLGFVSMKHVIGKRLGEAFACVHAQECAGGCGTSANCRICDVAQSFNRFLNGSIDECGNCVIESSLSKIDQLPIGYVMKKEEIAEKNYYILTLSA